MIVTWKINSFEIILRHNCYRREKIFLVDTYIVRDTFQSSKFGPELRLHITVCQSVLPLSCPRNVVDNHGLSLIRALCRRSDWWERTRNDETDCPSRPPYPLTTLVPFPEDPPVSLSLFLICGGLPYSFSFLYVVTTVGYGRPHFRLLIEHQQCASKSNNICWVKWKDQWSVRLR